MIPHGPLVVHVLDGQHAVGGGGDALAWEDPEALAEPLVVGLGVVVALLKGEDAADGGYAAEGEAAVAREAVVFLAGGVLAAGLGRGDGRGEREEG